MFSTIRQFESLASHKLEGMENLISDFRRIIHDFRGKRHPLLAYQNNKFDRDYVEFNVKISDLESFASCNAFSTGILHFSNNERLNCSNFERSSSKSIFFGV